VSGDYKSLIDDQGLPIRIKASAIISILGAAITVGTLLASAGGKSEKLDAIEKRTYALESLPPRVTRLEAQFDEILRRLGPMDQKLDHILERRGH